MRPIAHRCSVTPGSLSPMAIDLLLALNAAETLGDLSPLKSLGLHKLKGSPGILRMVRPDRTITPSEIRAVMRKSGSKIYGQGGSNELYPLSWTYETLTCPIPC